MSGDSLQVVRPPDGDAAVAQALVIIGSNLAVLPAGAVISNEIAAAAVPTLPSIRSLLSPDVVANSRPESAGDGLLHGERVADVAPVSSPGFRVVGTSWAIHALEQSKLGMSAVLSRVGLDDFPAPIGDDLMPVVLPFDRASLERAVDHFFQQLDELEMRDLVAVDLTQIVFASLSLASTVVALELVRRRLRHSTGGANGLRVRDRRIDGNELGFPDLPGSWSSRLT